MLERLLSQFAYVQDLKKELAITTEEAKLLLRQRTELREIADAELKDNARLREQAKIREGLLHHEVAMRADEGHRAKGHITELESHCQRQMKINEGLEKKLAATYTQIGEMAEELRNIKVELPPAKPKRAPRKRK